MPNLSPYLSFVLFLALSTFQQIWRNGLGVNPKQCISQELDDSISDVG